MIRFGTNSECFSILNIDTTFDLGKFYVTIITYRNLSLCLKDEPEVHPVFIGPVLIHQKRDKLTYIHLANSLKQYDIVNLYKLDRIIAFITDDDAAIHEAFKAVFPDSDYMLCRNHLLKDICRKLNEFRVDESDKNEINKKVFGGQSDRTSSLIGSCSIEEFEDRANVISSILNRSILNIKSQYL